MTERQNRIIIQILITVAFLVSFGPLFGIADFFQTSIIIDDFRPYLLTTWEGRIYLLALGMHIVMFLTAAFGIIWVLCRLRKRIWNEK